MTRDGMGFCEVRPVRDRSPDERPAGGRSPKHQRRSFGRAAFSLPELMIALAILGLGLLIIAAALPVGLTYTQTSVNLTTGDAAADYAEEVVAASLILPGPPANGATLPHSRGNVFLPTDATGALVPAHEPIIKVRAIVANNIDVTPGNVLAETADLVENEIAAYFGTTLPPGFTNLEYDDLAAGSAFPLNLASSPAFSSVARAFPPVARDAPFTANYFASNQYASRGASVPEMRRVTERRFVWTAFYRRASYEPGSDPSLYEVIVVVCRRPGEGFRFSERASGLDRVAPVPQLVTFDPAYALPPNIQPGDWLNGIVPDPIAGTNPERLLRPDFPHPPTLTFKCRPSATPPNPGDGAKFPPGTVFIPAMNDLQPPSRASGFAEVGLAPNSPSMVPIYEVIERPDADTIVVKNESNVYPWVKSGNATAWPVWVIPPAMRIEGTVKIFENQSPVVTVSRSYMHFPTNRGQ